ncbi:hypothetical protein ACFQMA_02660 [Halosimplex aquaticum]|uniref:Uncharacterized protein n=1 Tax=Halosimplex aquaticum TaxID=3026162 RepID=A0ABD5XZV5_9EURY|nr:hypothetical protein [Halosimplex aquaticum]
MSLDRTTRPLDVENARVFDYRRDVIVELHGETPDGEFEAVTYVFRDDPDDAGLQSPEIDEAHEAIVYDALADADYTVA